MSDESEDPRRVGRDEMNLSEFPITLLTDYPPEGVKMLVFEDRHGKTTDVPGALWAPTTDVPGALYRRSRGALGSQSGPRLDLRLPYL